MVYPRGGEAPERRHHESDNAPKDLKRTKKKKRKKLPPPKVWKKERKEHKGKQLAKDTADDNRSSSNAPDPIIDQQPMLERFGNVAVVPEEFLFTNIKMYRLARALFPLSYSSASPAKAFAAQDIDHKASLRFNDLIKLLTSYPLSCDLQDLDAGVSFKVYRPARNGLKSAGITFHKPHGRNPRVERHVLANLAAGFEVAFGWEKQHFKLLGATDSETVGPQNLEDDADDEMDDEVEADDDSDMDDGMNWRQNYHDMEMPDGFW
jgi:hypothetical protein